jgi:prepilin-type N-terminal cleavage/methylation domain-containing protein
MKNSGHLHQRPRRNAFTLIELLVVIAIIGILTAMIFPIVGVISKKKKITVAQGQLKALEMAIEGYKTKLGYYPPDNPLNVVSNQLYFELMGTTNDGINRMTPTVYVTMDGSAEVDTTGTPNINSYFNVVGLANTSTRAHSDDQGAAASTFLDNLTPNQIGVLDPGTGKVKILICAVDWPAEKTPVPISGTTYNPWRYVSSHPTNNTATYDLWVDIVIGNKTNRVSNWSTTPIQL